MHKKSKAARTAKAANVARSEILAAIQRTGNNVAEVMNSLQALGAKFGINVNFTLGYKKSEESRESRRSGIHGIHSDHVENGQCQTQRKLHRKPQISKISKISSRNPEEITIPELAAMVADELGMNEDCALDALETAFELLEEYSLILDIGDIGILAGHEVNDDSCEAYNPCKACENFNNCGYCSGDEDEEEDEDTGDDDSNKE